MSQSRRVPFWLTLTTGLLAILLTLYVLAGFVLLPVWLERKLPEVLQEHFGWQSQVDDIGMNPFLLTLEITGLDVRDDDGEVINLERGYVDVSFLELLGGVIGIEDLVLDDPQVRVDLLEGYDVNFSRDWNQNHSQPEAASAETPQQEDGQPVEFVLHRLAITEGRIRLRDFTHNQNEEFIIEPLTMAVVDLANFPLDIDNGEDELTAVLDQQEIKWKGQITLSPLESRGRIEINQLSETLIGHFAGPWLPYRLQSGDLSLSTDYQLSLSDRFEFSSSNGEITINNAALALPDNDSPWLQIARGSLRDIRFDLTESQLQVGEVDVEGPDLQVLRDSEGRLNLLAPFAGDGQDEPAASQSGASQPASGSERSFSWVIDKVSLSNGRVAWTDQTTGEPVSLVAQQIEASVSDLGRNLDEPVPYKANLELASGGAVAIQGQVTLAPFNLRAGLSVDQLNLKPAQPYLHQAVKLDIAGGSLTIDGDLDLDGQAEPMTGTFSGRARLDDLALNAQGSGQKLIGLNNLTVSPLEYNLTPARLQIGTLALAEPYLKAVRNQDGTINLASLAAGSTSEANEPPPEDSAQNQDSEFIFRINQITLQDGQIDYADRSLDPDLATDISQLSGSISGLSNVAPQQGRLDLSATLAQSASLNLKGSLAAVGTSRRSELSGQLDGFNLPVAGPYFIQYLGYRAKQGQLNLNIDYVLDGDNLDGTNKIVIDNLTLGESVPSDTAINAPIKLGLALLENSDGVIDVDLPISGQLSDPRFSIGKVLMGSFTNLIVKAATSPFTMLGGIVNLAGFSSDQLNDVAFAPGQKTVKDSEREKLKIIAGAMGQKPNLTLKIAGKAAPEDRRVLQREAVFADLGLNPEADPASQLDALLGAYEREVAEPPASFIRNEIEASPPPSGSVESAFASRLLDALIQQHSLADSALRNLATARGDWIAGQLRQTYGIEPQRLFVQDPTVSEAAWRDGHVQVDLTLGAK